MQQIREIGFDRLRIGAYLFGRSYGDDLRAVATHRPGRECAEENRLCPMTSTVTPDATVALIRRLISLLNFAQSCGRLVEQEQPRIRGSHEATRA